ncbi:hypothetical protein [Clostridium thermobutyricum]|uniref:hypothetical protein n=1 Tax=Clostridium thermobutyricum TaxID=29372 RepID=UPI003F5255BF
MKEINNFHYPTKQELIEELEKSSLRNSEDKLLIMLIFLGVGDGKYEQITKIKKIDLEENILTIDNKKFELDEYTKKLFIEASKSDCYIAFGKKEVAYEKSKDSEYVFYNKINSNNPFGNNHITEEGLRRRFKAVKSHLGIKVDTRSLRASKILYEMKSIREKWTIRQVIVFLYENNLSFAENKIFQLLKVF